MYWPSGGKDYLYGRRKLTLENLAGHYYPPNSIQVEITTWIGNYNFFGGRQARLVRGLVRR